jgi:hypothetical protein
MNKANKEVVASGAVGCKTDGMRQLLDGEGRPRGPCVVQRVVWANVSSKCVHSQNCEALRGTPVLSSAKNSFQAALKPCVGAWIGYVLQGCHVHTHRQRSITYNIITL